MTNPLEEAEKIVNDWVITPEDCKTPLEDAIASALSQRDQRIKELEAEVEKLKKESDSLIGVIGDQSHQVDLLRRCRAVLEYVKDKKLLPMASLSVRRILAALDEAGIK